MILLLNHKEQRCGVYQFGKRVFDIIKNSNKHQISYREASSFQELNDIINNLSPKAIIFNWHHYTMSWLPKELNLPNIKQYFIFHDINIRQNYDVYLFFGDYDLNNSIPENKRFLLPRPLFVYKGNYNQNNIFTIGTFGFAFKQKGLPRLIEEVNRVFNFANINLKVSQAFFSDSSDVYKECQNIPRKQGIKLNISSEFLSEQQVLEFLAGNDINVFFYYDNGEGLSSATDYALSVKRPIAVTDCTMFRHFKWDQILLDKYNIKEIYDMYMNDPLSPLDEYYERWHPNNLIKCMDDFLTKNLESQ